MIPPFTFPHHIQYHPWIFGSFNISRVSPIFNKWTSWRTFFHKGFHGFSSTFLSHKWPYSISNCLQSGNCPPRNECCCLSWQPLQATNLKGRKSPKDETEWGYLFHRTYVWVQNKLTSSSRTKRFRQLRRCLEIGAARSDADYGHPVRTLLLKSNRKMRLESTKLTASTSSEKKLPELYRIDHGPRLEFLLK